MTTEILKEIDSIIGLLETKFNPNHDPDTGRFAEGGSEEDKYNARVKLGKIQSRVDSADLVQSINNHIGVKDDCAYRFITKDDVSSTL